MRTVPVAQLIVRLSDSKQGCFDQGRWFECLVCQECPSAEIFNGSLIQDCVRTSSKAYPKVGTVIFERSAVKLFQCRRL